MPHPRKHQKLSGDVHPPEVEDDFGGDERSMETAVADEAAPLVAGAGAQANPPRAAAPGGGMRFSAPTERYLDSARQQVRGKPLAYAAGAFVAGFVLAVITR